MSQLQGEQPTLKTTFCVTLLRSSDQHATFIESAQLVAIAMLISAESAQVAS